MDETCLSNGDVYTILTNKAAKGRKGALVAMVRGVTTDAVITDFLLVLFTRSLPFYAITFRKHTNAHRSRFNLLLLKKKRTQNSAVYRQTRINPSHN